MSSTSEVSTASDIQTDYMTLLVAQLQNQNPLDPLDNSEMASQLAQFSELQQLESMNTSFSQVLESVQEGYASSLIGKDVSFYAEAADGTMETQTGEVEEVVMQDDGDITLVVDGQDVSLADVTAIRE